VIFDIIKSSSKKLSGVYIPLIVKKGKSLKSFVKILNNLNFFNLDVVTINVIVDMGISEDIKQEKFKNELNKAIINIVYTNSWLNTRQAGLFKDYGLTMPQYNVLRILRGQHPKPATVNLLIDRMLDKSSNASRIVDKLEAKNLVIRKQCSNDRRAVDVLISDAGLELLKKIDSKLDKWEQDLSGLSEEECAQLNHLLDKLRT